jgi:hypothetical protein
MKSDNSTSPLVLKQTHLIKTKPVPILMLPKDYSNQKRRWSLIHMRKEKSD